MGTRTVWSGLVSVADSDALKELDEELHTQVDDTPTIDQLEQFEG
jgi:hypothetical protein